MAEYEKTIQDIKNEVGSVRTLPNGYCFLAQNVNNGGLTVPIESVDSYSLDEVITSNKWIDGKPIYKKTINFGALPNNTSKSVAHSISGIERVVKIEGNGFVTGYFYPLPYPATTSVSCISLYATDTNIVVGSGSDRSSINAYITIYYTKTT